MAAVAPISKTFWTPLDEKHMLVAADTLDNRRQYERLAMRTFFIPGASSSPRLERHREPAAQSV